MKQSYLLLFLLVFILSCDKIDDANTVDFDTSISMEIPISVIDPNAMALKSIADYSFSQSSTASLVQNYEIADYLDKIKSIEVENLEIIFYGLEPGTEIKTISLSVQGVGVIATITNITSSNTVHSPAVDNSKLKQIASQLTNNWMITATVSGTTNFAPMWFTINMEYDIHVEAEAL